ncbi:MAG: hypothetical protein ACO3SO_08860 [Luteolibacter sp.]
MPEEQDRYQLDEMMDRLHERTTSEHSGEGELVTREDGSQVIRVRRRKRRSHQPEKERRRRIRIMQLTAALLVLLVALLMVGFVTIYVNTESYRKQLSAKLEATSGAQAKLIQFRMNPGAANAQGLDLKWPQGSALDSLQLRLLSADITPVAVIAGKFHGNEMSIGTGKLSLGLPVEGESRRIVPVLDGDAPIRFKQYGVKRLQIEIDLQDAGIFRLNEVEATLVPEKEGESSLLRMTRGDLRAPDWPMFRLDRGYIKLGGGQAKVVGLGLLHPQDDAGKLEFSGILSPHDRLNPSLLEVSAESFLLSGLLGDSLGELFSGRVDSRKGSTASQLEVGFGPDPMVDLDLNFQVSKDDSLTLRHLPVLLALCEILGDDWYAEPAFRGESSGILIRAGNQIELRELNLFSGERMAIRGRLGLHLGKLQGELRIGLPAAKITISENRALDKMFGSPTDGYRWMDLSVSGTAARPMDSFVQAYDQALTSLRAPAAGSARDRVDGDQANDRSFEELTKPR